MSRLSVQISSDRIAINIGGIVELTDVTYFIFCKRVVVCMCAGVFVSKVITYFSEIL